MTLKARQKVIVFDDTHRSSAIDREINELLDQGWKLDRVDNVNFTIPKIIVQFNRLEEPVCEGL